MNSVNFQGVIQLSTAKKGEKRKKKEKKAEKRGKFDEMKKKKKSLRKLEITKSHRLRSYRAQVAAHSGCC